MTLPFSIMLITDERPDLTTRIARALSIAPTRTPLALQLRLKHAARNELLAIATDLRALTRERRVHLLINDRIDVALEVDADGVHLPARGLSIALARTLLPAGSTIGVSCHTAGDVERATNDGASYALLSPVRAVPGKAPPLGIEGFAAIAQQTTLPVLALGGITAADVNALRAAGAAGFAVMRGVMLAASPSTALASFRDAWERMDA